MPSTKRERMPEGRGMSGRGVGVFMADLFLVMAGFIPAIHVFFTADSKDVDARDKPGHDEINATTQRDSPRLRPAPLPSAGICRADAASPACRWGYAVVRPRSRCCAGI